MLIKCLAIDDEPLALQVIKAHLNQMPDVELMGIFQNPVEALNLLETTEVDLIFLDIEMPLISGIEFLKTFQNPPKVIFTTAYRNYATESYELDVVDYLLKPISFPRFFKAMNRYKKLSKITTASIPDEVPVVNDHTYVNVNKKFVKINFDDILYIESVKDYVHLHLSEKSVVTKDSITNFENKLPYKFLRIHRSFIVNTDKITAFTKADVEIDTKELPIGASYKDRVMEFLADS